MSQPLPNEIILPSGQAGYLNPYSGTYSTSRAYALRMQRNYRRGLSQSEARGHRVAASGPRAGLSETQVRAQAAQAAGYETPWQRFTLSFERRYGFSYSYWRYLKRNWVDEINARTSGRGQITPSLVQQELANASFFASTGMPAGKPWIEQRLDEKLEALYEFQEERDNSLGLFYWQRRDYARPVEWWWYH